MHEYLGRLYVGTGSQTEIIRINADDTWDLVVGPPREATLPNGSKEWKYPISGLDAGFGHSLNDHAWQMDDPYGFLYVGTYNASIAVATSDGGLFYGLIGQMAANHCNARVLVDLNSATIRSFEPVP